VELAAVVAELERRGYAVTALGCGVSPSPVRVPLERVLKAHPLLHASEGDLFRDAVAEAAEGWGWRFAACHGKRSGLNFAASSVTSMRERVAKLGADLGPPWTSDQKEASAAAAGAGSFLQDAPAVTA
jgi:hypothetical protein